MSLVLADRVRETTDSTGTGTITLGGAVTGFQSFSVIGNNNTTYYTIAGTTQWEVGLGTYYGGTLSRDTIISSSTGSKLDLTAGTKDVFVTLPAEDVVTSVNGNVGDVTITAASLSAVPYTGATTAVDLNAKSLANVSHLSIGTATVADILARFVGDNNSASRIAVRGYSSDANSSSMRVTKFRGNFAAPQAPQSGDSLGKFELAGYGTTSSGGYPQASFEGVATEAWGATARGAKTLIKVTPNTTTTQVTAVTIDQDKSATFASTVSATTFSGSGASLTSIPNGALNNSAITINGASTSLGGSISVGTVTSVNATGTVSGLTLSGTVTSSGDITLGGAITGFATSGANTNLTSVALTSGTISTAPSNANDIVNKTYADSIATGINFHAACNYATIAALAANTYNNGTSGVGATLTANANGTLTIDGYTLVSGDVGKRLLIKNEATGANNGVYTLTQAGTAGLPYILTRATDYDTSGSGTNEIDQGDFLLVLAGSTLANTSWVQQTALPITVGTTAITFLQFGASGSGTVTSVSGTGTVSGLTLTGTVTSSGNLTLGGTLDLSSPPAIGGTTPAAGTHTTLNLTGTTNQVSSVAVSSDPAAPSAGNLKTFARTIAGGYTAPAFLNATQNVAMLQPAFANKRIGNWFPLNNASPTVVGLNPFTGTVGSVIPTTTSMFTRANRITNSSSATAGTLANYYQTVASYTLGSATSPAYGGFYFVQRFGIADTVASPRSFFGVSSSTGAPTNVEPSTLTNSIGVGQGAANTNLFVYYGGSAAQTPIDLGSNFPTGTSNTDLYELTLFAPPTSNNTVYYQVIRLNTGNVASGTLTGTAGTVLPSNTTYLAIRNWRTNNATASAVTIAIAGLYTETDY